MESAGIRPLRSWTPLLLLLVGLTPACAEQPEAPVLAAIEAAESGDMDGFTAQFTERSSTLIRSLDTVSSRTRGELTYMKDLFSILPRGSVQGVEIEDERAVVLMATETGTSRVVLLKEGGEWKIDALSLPRMWEPAGGDG